LRCRQSRTLSCPSPGIVDSPEREGRLRPPFLCGTRPDSITPI
jgi:hypothetical protein